MKFGNFLVGLLLGTHRTFWKKHKKLIRRGLTGLIILLLINFIVSCYYYKVSTTHQPPSGELMSLSDLGKSFVVHRDYNAYYVDSLRFSSDSIELFLGLTYYRNNEDIRPVIPNSAKRYRKKKGDARLLNEVHLYVNQNTRYKEKVWMVALTDLERLDIYNHSTNHTIGYSILFGIAMIPVAYVAFTLLWLLAMLLSGNSCPFIYTYNGEDFVFAGEIYSGAVYKPLERHDYLLLPDLVEDKGEYKLKISNQLEEVQYTNMLELLVFYHEPNQEVLVDKYGMPHSLAEPGKPLSATNLKGSDVKKLLEDKDDLIYVGDDPSKDPPLLDGVILSFDLPKGTNRVDLVIEAKNSYWLDFVYKNFREMLGVSYNMWMKKQAEGDAQKMKNWSLSQNIPLSVYMRVDGEWVFLDYFNSVGPMAFKQDILSLDISEMGAGPLEIKLEAGSYFWEIGYVALGVSQESEFVTRSISLSEAIDEKGEDVSEEMIGDDNRYYVQPEIGNEASLVFPVPEMTGEDRTIVLHSKGYYEILMDPKGAPKLKALKEIRKSGNFNVYSNQLMQEMLAEHKIQDGKMGKRGK
ncbi:MAG: hypothetical protein ABFS28_12920 [Bacteroidota bacterium]